ncbi:MAG: hypothetical protein NDJ94_24190, partial [Vicinamibacteria bacterium]|nr:hypothetical protein [Vicinamibacteria bacterium]
MPADERTEAVAGSPGPERTPGPPGTRVPTDETRVLVVDDDAALLAAIADQLSEAGYRVTTAP